MNLPPVETFEREFAGVSEQSIVTNPIFKFLLVIDVFIGQLPNEAQEGLLVLPIIATVGLGVSDFAYRIFA